MTEPAEIAADAMAELIVDALVDAGLVQRERFDEAVAVAAEEIRVRQALGNYLPAQT